ncbi:hypothetical protein SISNIDRAFT_491158 [Sistotremastrum niveocremeum HHB9708]|uniref:Uncharacterized protein n=1 Tax=Sistotremastrum niveocremeum HHB9708 TaxID=1314777 RepID=A0A164N327_9AGAM|nr:hypothetical protein SISNIDRAFT_491158 [Sistotremastrum niveocremeum HHB9708]
MSNIHVDSELMLHMMPAQVITTARRFTAVHDEAHRPLLFSLSSTGRLLAIKSDGQGNHLIVNLSDVLGISGVAEAFAVTQSTTVDGTLFVAFATKSGTNTSNLHVLSPLSPKDLDLPAAELKKKLLSSTGQPQNAQITQLHLNASTDGSYPLLVAIYTDQNKNLNISRIAITSTSWTWTTDLRIPELAKGFIGMAAGKLAIGDGVFILYTVAGKLSLVFSTTEPGQKTTVDLKFPPAATPGSIATFLDDDGFSNVLVAGGGLYHFSADDAMDSGTIATQLSRDKLLDGQVENLFVAQSGADFTAWWETKDHNLAFHRGKNDGSLIGTAVPLLSSGANAEFAPLLDPTSKSQQLVVMDDKSNLTVYEQSYETRMWNKTPLLIRQYTEMTEISAFVSRIKITTDKNWPRGNTPFILSSTAWVTVLVNGTQYSVGTAGTKVMTDASGVLTLIVPSQDLTCYTFTLKDWSSKFNSLPKEGFSFDPSMKVQDRLASIKSGDDIRNMKTSDGKPILEGSSASKEDVDKAGKAIGAMHSALNKETVNAPSSATTKKAVANSGVVRTHSWDFFEWVEQSAAVVADWFLEQVGDVWHFVVDLAGEVWQFVIDSIDAIAKAATFVFELLQIGWKKLVNVVGFIFNWEDIKHTRDSIKSMFNAGFDFGSQWLLNHRTNVETFFDELETKALLALKVKFPKGGMDRPQGPELLNDLKDSKKQKTTESAPANMGTYYFEQAKKAEGVDLSLEEGILDLYEKVLSPALAEVDARAKSMATIIVDLYSKNHDISISEIFRELGPDLIKLFVGIIKRIVTGLMSIASIIVKLIKKGVNSHVKIPIITPLMTKLEFKEFDFSWLDAITIVLAIPVTIIAKTITGKAPTRIQNFDYAAMIDGRLDRPSLLAFNELAQYLDITYANLNVLIKTVQIMTAEAPKPPAFSLGTFVLDIIVKIATFPYDKESPGRDYRIYAWSVLTANVVTRSAFLALGLPGVEKIIAVGDILVVLVTFGLTQAVHHAQLNEEWKDKDEAVTGLSITSSVFTLVSDLSTAYGIITPDPAEKAVAAVITAGGKACVAVIKTGKSAIVIHQKQYAFIESGI